MIYKRRTFPPLGSVAGTKCALCDEVVVVVAGRGLQCTPTPAGMHVVKTHTCASLLRGLAELIINFLQLLALAQLEARVLAQGLPAATQRERSGRTVAQHGKVLSRTAWQRQHRMYVGVIARHRVGRRHQQRSGRNRGDLQGIDHHMEPSQHPLRWWWCWC